jgi:hypothetical protein
MKMPLHCPSIRLASLINFPNPASILQPLVDTFQVRASREGRINWSVPVFVRFSSRFSVPTATVEDVWFAVDQTHSIATQWLDVPDDIAALPDAKGYGQVYDLHQAMVRDQSGVLKSLVSQFAAAGIPIIL